MFFPGSLLNAPAPGEEEEVVVLEWDVLAAAGEVVVVVVVVVVAAAIANPVIPATIGMALLCALITG
ncbi:hypothetical protein CHARACLAT_033690 [Characodon lateralis]|uniref:Uncharacterized protein n=1 Tax=Characodon lateralis TaxID=208331 RepID=A0ABU7EGF3_9TELE|nr:hypothetical protein [Characodon lateralis]